MSPAACEDASIPKTFFELALRQPDRELYSQALIDSSSDAVCAPRPRRRAVFGQVRERVLKIAAYLRRLGLKKGEKAAIISATRPEWMEADIAILAAGGVVVAVYPTLIVKEVGYILYDSGAKLVFAENQEQLDKLLELASQPCLIPAVEDRQAMQARLHFKHIITFEKTARHELAVNLQEILESEETPEISAFEWPAPRELASIVYTSGTTGPPKGVLQTHANHLANLRQALEAGMYKPGLSAALFLPLAHSFGRLLGYTGFLKGVRLEFLAIFDPQSSRAAPQSIMRDLREGAAQIVPVVPRILEKMQEAVLKRAAGRGVEAAVLRITLRAALRRHEERLKRIPPSLWPRLIYRLSFPLRRRIRRELFGRAFEYAVCGGAKLQPEVQEFFAALGMEVLEGYGATETCVATNVNRRGAARANSVGPVLTADIEMKIAADGEICFRGPNVALGYHNRPQATAQAWDEEGWYRSGDLGAVDRDGCLTITGRKKELIITSGGKKVAPDGIEQKLAAAKLISQVMLVGEGRPYCIALVALNREAVRELFAQAELEPPDSAGRKQAIREAVWKEVENINRSLSSYESIKKVLVIAEDFSVENGMLTPTLKVRRAQVLRNYSREIEGLYGMPEKILFAGSEEQPGA